MALARSTAWLVIPRRHAHVSATTLLRTSNARWHPPVCGTEVGPFQICGIDMTVALLVSGPNFHACGAMLGYVSVKSVPAQADHCVVWSASSFCAAAAVGNSTTAWRTSKAMGTSPGSWTACARAAVHPVSAYTAACAG